MEGDALVDQLAGSVIYICEGRVFGFGQAGREEPLSDLGDSRAGNTDDGNGRGWWA
jgi:hypothetical protein